MAPRVAMSMPECVPRLGRSAVQADILAPVESYGVHRPARRMKALGMIALGMSLLTACSTGGPPLCASASQDNTESRGYSLGSGDRLRVVVFRHPDLSGEFALDGEGYLALPLVGEIAAGGLTTRQLEDEIETRLKADDLLVSPHVGVQVVTYRSFYVLGEVGTPGSYEYQNGMTVINAVALAGGYTPRADQSSATIGRGDCRFATQANTFVKPGDILTIAERFF
jgi:protein involved in polysaccharide export with SLBB domain